MARNEPILAATSYFWSNALNAFLFGHGPMTPTLADVMMITGLNITAPDTFFSLPAKATHQIKSKNIDDWKGYIGFYSKSVGSVDSKEHFAFLNMWLEKHVLCGKPAGHAVNPFPLGKYLIGETYNVLPEVSV